MRRFPIESDESYRLRLIAVADSMNDQDRFAVLTAIGLGLDVIGSHCKETPMRRVIIETPFAGRGPWPLSTLRRWRNVRYARRCLRHSVLMGEAPMASHLLYTQVLDDSVADERRMGIEAGLAWGAVADATVVYVDREISAGMLLGIKRARAEGRPVEFRSLDPRRVVRGSRSEP